MEIANYLANNVPLFSVCAVMLFLSIRNFKVRKKESIHFIVFTGIVLFLSVVCEMEQFGPKHGLVVLSTIFASIGYILRPVLLYIFILIANMNEKRSVKFYLFLGIPLAINLIIYLFPLFFGVPGLSTMVFSYVLNGDGVAEFVRGTFLNFSSHIVCALYVVALMYVSVLRFHGKHRRDGLVMVLCVIFISATVLTEMLAERNDLLNIVCEICLMINYIFITSVNASRDTLTKLYDRGTFYEDISRYKDLVNGVVQIDMNGLKYLNDNFGHESGDEALKAIAEIFEDNIDRTTMVVYRLSGDEFLILMYHGSEESLKKTVNSIREEMAKSKYSVAIGCVYYDKKNKMPFDEAMKKAEELMYLDKERHYKESGNDRRKR